MRLDMFGKEVNEGDFVISADFYIMRITGFTPKFIKGVNIWRIEDIEPSIEDETSLWKTRISNGSFIKISKEDALYKLDKRNKN